MSWVVVKQAVYMHNVYGPWEKQEDAKRAAVELARADEDDHHSYQVRRLRLTGFDSYEPTFSVDKGGVSHLSDYEKDLEAKDMKIASLQNEVNRIRAEAGRAKSDLSWAVSPERMGQ